MLPSLQASPPSARTLPASFPLRVEIRLFFSRKKMDCRVKRGNDEVNAREDGLEPEERENLLQRGCSEPLHGWPALDGFLLARSVLGLLAGPRGPCSAGRQ
jgi:hypothetical protein